MNARFVSLSALLFLAVSFASCKSSDSHESKSAEQYEWNDSAKHQAVPTLDGRAYTIQMGESGKALTEKDDLDFTSGRFHSSICDQYGFKPSPYTAHAVEGGSQFHALCTNPDGVTNDWKGTIKGDAIEGAVTRTQPGKPPVEYVFRGHAAKT